MNETKGEYYLHRKKISKEQAEEYITKNMKSDEIVVFVEGHNVDVCTFHEAAEITTSIFKALFSHKGQPLDSSGTK